MQNAFSVDLATVSRQCRDAAQCFFEMKQNDNNNKKGIAADANSKKFPIVNELRAREEGFGLLMDFPFI